MTDETSSEATGAANREEQGRGRELPRAMVMRRLLALYDEPRYLEIGVARGRTFHKLTATAAQMVAVDPMFRFDAEDAARERPHARYHEVTSDEYFGSIVGPDEQFDVIYLDGLHVFEQTLRDLLNALHHLQPKGVIVIDDVRPPTYLASLPDRESFFRVRDWLGSDDRRWMGDVFKVLFFVDTFCQQLSYRTISNNHGQAVVWRRRRTAVTERDAAQIAALDFAQLVAGEEVLRRRPFAAIVQEVCDDLGLRRATESSATGPAIPDQP